MVLAGLAVIAVAIAGALLLLVEDDDEGTTTPVETETGAQQAELGSSLDDPKRGISVQWPSDWAKIEKSGAIGLQSPERSIQILISDPAEAADADQLRRDAIASTEAGYKNPVVRHGKGRTIGGLPADGATVSGRGPAGESVTLVAVARGKGRAYLFEVVTAANAPTERLVEAQLILNSLQLTK